MWWICQQTDGHISKIEIAMAFTICIIIPPPAHSNTMMRRCIGYPSNTCGYIDCKIHTHNSNGSSCLPYCTTPDGPWNASASWNFRIRICQYSINVLWTGKKIDGDLFLFISCAALWNSFITFASSLSTFYSNYWCIKNMECDTHQKCKMCVCVWTKQKEEEIKACECVCIFFALKAFNMKIVVKVLFEF